MALLVCVPKVETQKYLREKVNSNPGFSYAGIANGLFLDWGLKVGFILNLASHSATLYNGGDVPFSTTTLAAVARATLAIIKNQDRTANQILYIHSAVTTQNKLIQYARDKNGKEWNTSIKDTEEIRRKVWQSWPKVQRATSWRPWTDSAQPPHGIRTMVVTSQVAWIMTW